jgi:hypothetical protein
MIGKQKIVSLFLVGFVLLSLFTCLFNVGEVEGQIVTVIDSAGNLPPVGYVALNSRYSYWQSPIGVYDMVAVGFVGNGLSLNEVQLYLYRTGTPASGYDPEIVVEVRGSNNNLLSGFPGSTVYATSDVILFSELPIVGDWVSFVFDGSFSPVLGGVYFLCIVSHTSGLSGLSSGVSVNVGYAADSNSNRRSVRHVLAFTYDDDDNLFGYETWSFVSSGNNVLFRALHVVQAFGVTYDGNGATGGSVPVDSNLYGVGGAVTVKANVGGLVRVGYDFLGWAYSASASVPDFVVSGGVAAPSFFSMGSSNVVLFAVWGLSVGPTPTHVVVPEGAEGLVLRFGDKEVDNFGVLGYWMGERAGGVTAGFESDWGVATDVQLGFRVWLVGEDGETELTLGEPVGVASIWSSLPAWSGWVNTSWACPGVRVVLGEQVLNIVMYSSVDDGVTWFARAGFVSDVLLTNQIVGSDWVFNFHLSYELTAMVVGWSGVYGRAGVDGVLFVEPSVFDVMFFKLVHLDVFGFVLVPYLAVLGEFFYVLVLIFMLGAYYMWHGKASVVLFMLVLFGSAGGLVFVFLPAPANILVWVLLAVALGVLLFRVFR